MLTAFLSVVQAWNDEVKLFYAVIQFFVFLDLGWTLVQIDVNIIGYINDYSLWKCSVNNISQTTFFKSSMKT